MLKKAFIALVVAAAFVLTGCTTLKNVTKHAPGYALNGARITLGLQDLLTDYSSVKESLVAELGTDNFTEKQATEIKNILGIIDQLEIELVAFLESKGAGINRIEQLTELQPLLKRAKASYVVLYDTLSPKVLNGELPASVAVQLIEFHEVVKIVDAEYAKLKQLPDGTDITPWVNDVMAIGRFSVTLLRLYGKSNGVPI